MESIGNYKILIGEKASPLIKFASEELQSFIEKATGIKLEIVTKLNGGHYISIDKTPLSESVEFPELDNFNTSGFSIKTADDNFIVMGKSEQGSLYGVYHLLETWIDFNVYAIDEIYYTKNATITLSPINFSYCPKIEYRHNSWYPTYNPTFANRAKMYAGGIKMDGHKEDWYYKDWGNGYFAHTTFKVLPPEKDKDGNLIHKDWYNQVANQLCFSNDEMYNQFLINLKKHIKENPEAKFFSIGIEDNGTACNCERCKKNDEIYGGPCGTYLHFIKRLAVDVEEWRKAELPDSHFLLVAFAYLFTKDPPVKIDENGNFKVYHEDLILPDNVAIFNAPIDACGLHSLNAPCNKGVLDRFTKWQLYCKKSFVWDYHLYHDRVLIFFPSFWQYKNNIKTYEKFNTIYVFNEGEERDFTTGFADLKCYLLYKLEFNSDLDQDYLIDDFIDHYYKSSAPKIKLFLKELKKHYSRLEKVYAKKGGRGYHVSYDVVGHPDVLTETHWPKNFLLKMEKILAEAESLADNDLIKKRVLREQIFIKYLLIEIHTYYCIESEFNRRVDEFKNIVASLGDMYNYATWFNKDKDPEKHPFAIKHWYGVLSCRYPVRADNLKKPNL